MVKYTLQLWATEYCIETILPFTIDGDTPYNIVVDSSPCDAPPDHGLVHVAVNILPDVDEFCHFMVFTCFNDKKIRAGCNTSAEVVCSIPCDGMYTLCE